MRGGGAQHVLDAAAEGQVCGHDVHIVLRLHLRGPAPLRRRQRRQRRGAGAGGELEERVVSSAPPRPNIRAQSPRRPRRRLPHDVDRRRRWSLRLTPRPLELARAIEGGSDVGAPPAASRRRASATAAAAVAANAVSNIAERRLAARRAGTQTLLPPATHHRHQQPVLAVPHRQEPRLRVQIRRDPKPGVVILQPSCHSTFVLDELFVLVPEDFRPPELKARVRLRNIDAKEAQSLEAAEDPIEARPDGPAAATARRRRRTRRRRRR
mmetsp:Transcript_89227/g.288423  ORF Transcript_89227/g.288423 Transcript_89227/m.288423 type:complete len:267 (-) Transcript_89227:18-818(-)